MRSLLELSAQHVTFQHRQHFRDRIASPNTIPDAPQSRLTCTPSVVGLSAETPASSVTEIVQTSKKRIPAMHISTPSIAASQPIASVDQAMTETVTNQNLCDFFIQELASALASADAILASAETIENWIPARHAALHSALAAVAKTARHCRGELCRTLDDHGIHLFATPNPAIVALLESLSPTRRENLFEPWGVFGTRMMSVFRKASLQMELQATELSEYAFLLGSDALCETLRDRANEWSACTVLLHAKKTSFCAEAYMGGTENAGHQLGSKHNHNTQPKSPCYAGL